MRYSISKLKYCLTSLLMCMVLLPTNVGAQTPISTADEWLNIAKRMTNTAAFRKDNYVITADLDFTGKDFIPLGGLAPMGAAYKASNTNSFTGTLDGGNHKLKNITKFAYTKASSGYYIGVVGFAKGATIKNLIVENYQGTSDACFKNASYNGGICGNLSTGSIENCALINSTLYGGTGPLGGIAGYLNGGTIKNCVVDNVTFDNASGTGQVIGGIVGNVSAEATVINCYANASFPDVVNRVGGIVGMISHTVGITNVANCYSTGSIVLKSGDNVGNIGGVIGYLGSADVKNCGSSDSISVLVSKSYQPQNTGGAFGIINNKAVTFSNIYATGRLFFTEERGESEMAGMNAFYGNNKSGAEFPVPANCYNAREYYKYMENGDYLASIAGIVYGKSATLMGKDSVRSGCLANVMNDDQGLSNIDDIIWTYRKGCFNNYPVPFAQCDDLINIMVEAGVITAEDGDALKTKMPSCGDEETTIHIKTVEDMANVAKAIVDNESTWSADKTFVVDNDITGAVTTVIGTASKPFLGVFDGASHIINMSVKGSDSNVGVIGYAGGNAKIKNVQTTGSVAGKDNVGGIVGSATTNVTITNCANAATVSGSTKVGGIVGASAGSASGCLNVANVSGTANVGGIAGAANNLSDCANMGYVKCAAATTTGGVAGVATGTVKNCLSAGFVEGAAISNGGTLTNCFFDEALAVNGQTGATAVTMSADEDFSKLAGWSVTKGSYAVPAGVASSVIAKVAKQPIYFVNGDKANNVVDSVATSADWLCDNTNLLKYHVGAFLPVKAGAVMLTLTDGKVVRSVPVSVSDLSKFSGGYGNEFAPFLITKQKDVADMATYVAVTDGAKGKIFELQNDITDGAVTLPVGSQVHTFKGIFRSAPGKLYNIPLSMSYSSPAPVGLVGVNNGLVERISVTGSVTNKGMGTSAFVAGIVGYNSGRIVGCVNDADVAGSSCCAAGIAGAATGSISKCVNLGTVTSGTFAAGVATCNESALELSDCFNSGVVNGASAAGIVVMTGGDATIQPHLSNNVNAGAVNGAKSDPLVYKGTAAPVITGGIYDNQHSLATSTNATAIADSTRKLTNETISGWTSSANKLYPQILSGDASKLAASPVFLNKVDSANNVKHEFSVAEGVVWKSAQGLLKVSGTKVTRVAAGNDTLIATSGKFTRCIPITVSCVWDTIIEPVVDVCNMYAGVTYKENTVLSIVDTTDNTNPNADCGTIHIRKINVSVGTAGETLKFNGCGSYTYNGEVFKKDTLFTNKNCDYVHITVYPAAVNADSVVKLTCEQESYTYKASDGKTYTVKRTTKPIADSLVVVDNIKSKVCDCDSIVRKVYVTIPTAQTETVVETAQCNTYSYKKFNGQTVTLGFPVEKRDPDEVYWKADFQNVVYRDTNFTSGKEFDKINVVKVSIFKSVFMTDTTAYVGKECSSLTYAKADGGEIVFAGERYLKDTLFYDSVKTSALEGCPATIIKVKVRLKGISTVNDTIYIGSHNAGKCKDCKLPIVLNDVKGDEYKNVGFCDMVSYKRFESTRAVTKTADFVEKISFDADETSCGSVTPFKISVNASVHKDKSLTACDSLVYTTRDNQTFTIRRDTSFADVLSGVVPGCGCDSVWDVKVKIFSPKFEKKKITACDSYTFSYLDKTVADINIVRDTMIVDTVKNFMGCDSIIRTSTIEIHKGYPASENTPVEVVACQTYTYTSPVKGDIVCTVDTMFNDTLVSEFGCDSIIPVSITITQPVVVDSVIHVCGDFLYKKRSGATVLVQLGDNPAIIDTAVINDVWKNENPMLCDTLFNLTVCSHATRVIQPKVTPVCGYKEYTRFNGTKFEITESITVYDTLKSKVCDCDSIVRIDSFSVGSPYYPTAETKLDTTLYGCRFNVVLTYKRKSNPWNPDTTISYVPVSSETANQQGFLDIVRKSNPSVVALDTVRVKTESGRYINHYYWLAHDTMHTQAGCDSVVPFRVEYDGQHTLGRRYFYVDHKYAPFEFDGTTYELPDFNKGVASHDSIEVVLPSTTGGCDTSYFAMIKMYPCKVIDTTMHWCDMATFFNLHHEQMKFYKDTVYSDTLRYYIPASDTARCDSVIKTWHVKVGYTTPVSEIKPVYVGGCDEVTFHRSGVATNMVAEDTTFATSTTFRCRYINHTGCDSVVPVNAVVHEVLPMSVIVKKTDFYRYVSPLDHSITRITSDTTIEERVPDAVSITLGDGSTFTCDSVIITQVTIRPAEWRDTVITGCDSVYAIAMSVANDSIRGEFDEQPKQWYYENTTFNAPNQKTIEPYYHVKIELNKSVYRSVTIDSCRQVTYKGKVYTESTQLIERMTSVNGCDSVDTVKIIVHPVIMKDRTISGCGYLSYRSHLYKDNDVVYDTIRYTNGCNCDSVITAINIDIIEPIVVKQEIDSCMFLTYPKLHVKEHNYFVEAKVNEVVPGKDTVYTASQRFYRYLGKDDYGCDSIALVQLNVNPCYPYPVIINKYNWILALNKDLLTKDVKESRITGYQWYKIENDEDHILKGATQSYYTEDASLNGCYKVHVKFGNKEIESESICVDPSKSVAFSYDVYPDPVAIGDKLSIKCNFDVEDASLEIYNMLGVKVYQGQLNTTAGSDYQIPCRFSNAGNYYLKLTVSDGTVLGKKFIVK